MWTVKAHAAEALKLIHVMFVVVMVLRVRRPKIVMVKLEDQPSTTRARSVGATVLLVLKTFAVMEPSTVQELATALLLLMIAMFAVETVLRVA